VSAQKKERGARKEVLEALLKGLKEIEAHFELEGFLRSVDVEGPAGEDGEGEDLGPVVFDREDIEVAIDLFISSLVQAKIVRKLLPGTRPSLADVMERFFGEDHDITQKSQEFEECVKGYFDLVGYDNVRQAYSLVSEMKGMIEEEIGMLKEKHGRG
jgi:hypothetical protein